MALSSALSVGTVMTSLTSTGKLLGLATPDAVYVKSVAAYGCIACLFASMLHVTKDVFAKHILGLIMHWSNLQLL